MPTVEAFFRSDSGRTVCSSVHVPKVLAFIHRSQSWCGCSCTLLPRSPYNNSCVVLCALYCSVSFALVVHYAGVDVYMYIHTVHRAVLDQGVLSASFQVLSSVIHSWGIRIQNF